MLESSCWFKIRSVWYLRHSTTWCQSKANPTWQTQRNPFWETLLLRVIAIWWRLQDYLYPAWIWKAATYHKIGVTLKNHIQPEINPIFIWYILQGTKQVMDMIEQFLTRIKMLVKDCEYPNPDNRVRDQLVFGINSEKACESLLNKGRGLNFNKAIHIIKKHEYNKHHLRAMKEEVDCLKHDLWFKRKVQLVTLQKVTGMQRQKGSTASHELKKTLVYF